MSSESKKSLQDRSPSELNLGLSALLKANDEFSSDSQTTDVEPKTNSSERKPEVTTPLQMAIETNSEVVAEIAGKVASTAEEQAQKTELDEFNALAQAASWTELTVLTEKIIAQGGEEKLTAKLWWIRSELERGQVPLIVLAGPLDSASQRILDKKNIAVSATELDFLKLKEMSSELLLELAQKLSDSDLQTAVVFAERAYRLNTSCAPTFLNFIHETISNIESIKEFERDKKSERVLSKLTNLRKELSVTLKTKETKSRATPVSSAVYKKRGSSHAKSYMAVCLITICSLLIVFWVDIFGRQDKYAYSPLEIFQDKADLGARLPNLDRQTGVGELDALLYDMRRGANVQEVALVSNNTTAKRVQANQIAAIDIDEPQVQRQSVSQAKPRIREEINTEGPVESRDMRAALSDESLKREREEPKVQLFPEPNTQRDDRRGKREREKYIVLKATDVLSKPSLGSRTVDYLPEGSEIFVESELGAWLLLRSKQGRAGYILANDAERVGDRYGR